MKALKKKDKYRKKVIWTHFLYKRGQCSVNLRIPGLGFPKTVYSWTQTKGAEQSMYPRTTTMVSLTVLTLAFEIVLIECVLGQMLGSLGLLEQVRPRSSMLLVSPRTISLLIRRLFQVDFKPDRN